MNTQVPTLHTGLGQVLLKHRPYDRTHLYESYDIRHDCKTLTLAVQPSDTNKPWINTMQVLVGIPEELYIESMRLIAIREGLNPPPLADLVLNKKKR